MTAYRSLLFVPGHRPDRWRKAVMAGADAVCIDLEDAVPPDQKDSARAEVFEWFAGVLETPCQIGVRINHPATEWGRGDLDEIARRQAMRDDASDDDLFDGGFNGPGFFMVPKIGSAADLPDLGGRALVAVIESARGMRHAWEIAEDPRVQSVLFGGADYAADVGCDMSWDALAFARGRLAAAAAAAEKPVFDVPHLDVSDLADLALSTARAKALGFAGRACIHPAQVDVVNDVFSPQADEIEAARAVIDAVEAAGGGAALLNGRLVEQPLVLAARRTLDRARAAQRSRRRSAS